MEAPNDLIAGSVHSTKANGYVVVVDYHDAFNVTVKFVDTGFVTTVTGAAIRRGQIKDKLKPSVYGVGYFGEGIHKASINKKPNQAYKVWQAMMQRCYDDAYKVYRPTYEGCTVCAEWHNFQVFADWFDKTYPRDGEKYQLDKDIKVKGNKVYSPETCLFVTLMENTAESSSKLYYLTSPSGEIVKIQNMQDFCFGTELDPSCMIKVAKGARKSHKGWKSAKLKEVTL